MNLVSLLCWRELLVLVDCAIYQYRNACFTVATPILTLMLAKGNNATT